MSWSALGFATLLVLLTLVAVLYMRWPRDEDGELVLDAQELEGLRRNSLEPPREVMAAIGRLVITVAVAVVAMLGVALSSGGASTTNRWGDE